MSPGAQRTEPPPRWSPLADGNHGLRRNRQPRIPLVLLEVQMHPDPGFRHRLAAQTYRFLQKHPQVEHLEVVVITPHQRIGLGPTQQPNRDPLLNLLTLPVRPESELAAASRHIVASRPDLDTVVLPMLVQRFPELTTAVSSRTSKSW